MQIMGNSVLTKAQMLEYINKANPSPKLNTNVSNLIDLFLIEGEIEGVRGDIAFVQATWETNNFKFTGDVVPAQNNYAGIGTIGGGVKGHYFDTPQLGVRAQIQHLKAYASKEPLKQAKVDPRYHLVSPKGKSPTVQGLSGTWAADKTYGNSLINRYNEIAKLPGGDKKVKICLDYGHGKNDVRGYVQNSKWKSEGTGNFYFGKMLRAELLKYKGISIVETRPTIDSRKSYLSGNALSADLKSRGNTAKGCDLFLSLHTNAGGGTGVEIFEDINSRATPLAKNLCSTIASTLGIRNRGVKYRYLPDVTTTTPPTGKSNYYGVLYNNLAKTGMLIEHCFHDNQSDVNKYENNAQKLAENMAAVIANYYGLKANDTSGLGGNTTMSKVTKFANLGDVTVLAKPRKFTEETREMWKYVEQYYNQSSEAQYIATVSGKFDYADAKTLIVVDKSMSGHTSRRRQNGTVVYLIDTIEKAKEYASQGQKVLPKFEVK